MSGGVRFYTGYLNRNFRVGKVKPKPIPEENPIIVTQPVWISAGDLGTFLYDQEVNLRLEYNDPSNIVTQFSLVGSLPRGLSLNTLSGGISGYIEDDVTQEYVFSVLMRTVLGRNIAQQFMISTESVATRVVWDTDEDLGVYIPGDTVSTTIEAYSEEIIK